MNSSLKGNHIKDLIGLMRPNTEIPVLSSENLAKAKEFASAMESSLQVVGTHSGCFHADEVLSCVLLKYTSKYKNSAIIRSRNTQIHEIASILVDVGGIFDLKTERFDHHQKEFTSYFEDKHKIKMSSAGLVYKYYGMEIITNILIAWKLYDRYKDMIPKMYNKLYDNFIMCVDAEDNGINQYEDNVESKYCNNTTYGKRIARLNGLDCNESALFLAAMDIAEDEFLWQAYNVMFVWFPSYEFLKNAVQERLRFHSSGQIVYLENGCAWKQHVYDIEEEYGIKDQIIFLISKNKENDYRVMTVPVSKGNFKFRKGLLPEWRGLEKQALAEVSGIPDIIFCHNSGFIGGAASYKSAMTMAEISLHAK